MPEDRLEPMNLDVTTTVTTVLWRVARNSGTACTGCGAAQLRYRAVRRTARLRAGRPGSGLACSEERLAQATSPGIISSVAMPMPLYSQAVLRTAAQLWATARSSLNSLTLIHFAYAARIVLTSLTLGRPSVATRFLCAAMGELRS